MRLLKTLGSAFEFTDSTRTMSEQQIGTKLGAPVGKRIKRDNNSYLWQQLPDVLSLGSLVMR